MKILQEKTTFTGALLRNLLDLWSTCKQLPLTDEFTQNIT